jgi:hypothetical protein
MGTDTRCCGSTCCCSKRCDKAASPGIATAPPANPPSQPSQPSSDAASLRLLSVFDYKLGKPRQKRIKVRLAEEVVIRVGLCGECLVEIVGSSVFRGIAYLPLLMHGDGRLCCRQAALRRRVQGASGPGEKSDALKALGLASLYAPPAHYTRPDTTQVAPFPQHIPTALSSLSWVWSEGGEGKRAGEGASARARVCVRERECHI